MWPLSELNFRFLRGTLSPYISLFEEQKKRMVIIGAKFLWQLVYNSYVGYIHRYFMHGEDIGPTQPSLFHSWVFSIQATEWLGKCKTENIRQHQMHFSSRLIGILTSYHVQGPIVGSNFDNCTAISNWLQPLIGCISLHR